EHEVGNRMQEMASMGLRSTRDTARHLEISDGGTSSVNELESLRKTHLTRTAVACTATHGQYTSSGQIEAALKGHPRRPYGPTSPELRSLRPQNVLAAGSKFRAARHVLFSLAVVALVKCTTSYGARLTLTTTLIGAASN